MAEVDGAVLAASRIPATQFEAPDLALDQQKPDSSGGDQSSHDQGRNDPADAHVGSWNDFSGWADAFLLAFWVHQEAEATLESRMDTNKASTTSKSTPRPLGRFIGPLATAAELAGRTARRPAFYPAMLREAGVAALNIGLMPVGVVRDVLRVENAFRLGDTHNSGTPLRYLEPEAASTPIILLHGYFHNRSAFVVMRRALKRAGFRTVSTVNYNPFSHGLEDLASQLSAHVEEVLGTTEAHQVHLVGHSLGGLVARYYVQALGGSEFVHTCATLGTPHQGTYAAYIGRGRAARQVRPNTPIIQRINQHDTPVDTRFISFYSNLDGMILPASNAKITSPALNAENILVKDLGHQSLLVSKSVTRQLAARLATLEPVIPSSDVPSLPGVTSINSRPAR